MFTFVPVRRIPGLPLQKKEQRILDRLNEGREISDQEVIDCIRSIPRHYAVGPTSGTDGSSPASVRYDRTGAQVVTQAHGKYFESSVRGKLFAASETGSGTAPGTTVSTTAALVLYNPQGSGIVLAIKKRAVTYFSGTLGTGTMFDCGLGNATQTAPSGGTALVTRSLCIGNAAAGVGLARVGATVVAPLVLWPAFYLAPELASSVTAPQNGTEDIDGAICVLPGCTYQMQAVAAAGTSPLICPAVMWEEVPIPS